MPQLLTRPAFWLTAYLVLMNLVTFWVYGADKRRARRGHVVHDPVVDGVGAGGDGPVQAAPAAHRVEVRQAEAALRHGVQNGLLAVIRLVDDPVEAVQLLGGVVHGGLINLRLLVENGHLGAGGAGVDD